MTEMEPAIVGGLVELMAAVNDKFSESSDTSSNRLRWKPTAALRLALKVAAPSGRLSLPTLLIDSGGQEPPTLAAAAAIGRLAPAGPLMLSQPSPRALGAALTNLRRQGASERVIWRHEDGSLESHAGALVLPVDTGHNRGLEIIPDTDPSRLVKALLGFWGRAAKPQSQPSSSLRSLRVPGPIKRSTGAAVEEQPADTALQLQSGHTFEVIVVGSRADV